MHPFPSMQLAAANGPYDTTPWPTMTGASSPAGYAMTASSLYLGDPTYAAWKTHDNDTATFWNSTLSTLPDWVQIQLPARQVMDTYTVTNPGGDGSSATSWTMSGSNDGVSWGVLDTRTAEAFSGSTPRTFSVQNKGAYNRYRLTVTGVVSGTVCGALREWTCTFAAFF